MAIYMKRAGAIDAGTHRCEYDQAFTIWIKRSRDLFVQFDRDYRTSTRIRASAAASAFPRRRLQARILIDSACSGRLP